MTTERSTALPPRVTRSASASAQVAEASVSSANLADDDESLAVEGDPFAGANSEVDYDESESEEEVKDSAPVGRIKSRTPSPVGEDEALPEEGEVEGNDNNDVVESSNEPITNSSDLFELLGGAIAARSRTTPWGLMYHQTRQWSGRKDSTHSLPLYNCETIRKNRLCRLEGEADRSDGEFIELFLKYRYFNPKRVARAPKFESLVQAWNAFVDNFTKDPRRWREVLEKHHFNYVRYNEDGLRNEIHQLCVEAGMPCALPRNLNCVWCAPGDPSIKSIDDPYWRNIIPAKIWELVDLLFNKYVEGPKANVSGRNQTQRQGRRAVKKYATPMCHELEDIQASVRDNSVRDDHSPAGRGDRSERQQSNVDRRLNRSEEVEEEDIHDPSLDLSPVYPAGFEPAGSSRGGEIATLRQELSETRERVRSLEGQLSALVADYKCLLGELNAQHIAVRRKRQRHADDKA